VLGNGGTGEFLAQQAGQEQQRTAWPVSRDNVLGLPGCIAGDQDYTADGLAADLSDVVLEKAVVAAWTGEPVLLTVIQRADGDYDGTDGLRALHDAVQERALHGGVASHVIQPRRAVVFKSGIAATEILGKDVAFCGHA